MSDIFQVGDHVEKHTGDYQLPGVVIGINETAIGKPLYAVEHFAGFVHLYSASNLRKIDPTKMPPREDSTYPTVWAYEQVCKLLEQQKAKTAVSDAAIEALKAVVIEHEAHADALGRRLNAYEHVLKVNLVKFRFYEQQHLAKGTTESAVKAGVNKGMAEMIEAVLS